MPYEIRWAASIVMMDNTANYVDGLAKGSIPIIEMAAYKAVNVSRVSAVKPTQAQKAVVSRAMLRMGK